MGGRKRRHVQLGPQAESTLPHLFIQMLEYRTCSVSMVHEIFVPHTDRKTPNCGLVNRSTCDTVALHNQTKCSQLQIPHVDF